MEVAEERLLWIRSTSIWLIVILVALFVLLRYQPNLNSWHDGPFVTRQCSSAILINWHWLQIISLHKLSWFWFLKLMYRNHSKSGLHLWLCYHQGPLEPRHAPHLRDFKNGAELAKLVSGRSIKIIFLRHAAWSFSIFVSTCDNCRYLCFCNQCYQTSS